MQLRRRAAESRMKLGRSISYQAAVDTPSPESFVLHVVSWILEAGNPYYRKLLGMTSSASVLEAWMRRVSSEVSIRRARFLVCDSQLAGGFIALGGAELRKARRADGIALMTGIRAEDRSALMNRLTNLADLFSPVADDEYYLSKLWLAPQFRGKRLGGLLLARYLDEGLRLGYTRYRLDVHTENEAAIRCYRSAGFVICGSATSKDGRIGYYSMKYEKCEKSCM